MSKTVSFGKHEKASESLLTLVLHMVGLTGFEPVTSTMST